MPRFKEHVAIGAVTGAAAAAIITAGRQLKERQANGLRELDWASLIGAALVGSIVGAMAAPIPDWLDPAIHPDHRSLFHSVAALGVSCYSMYALQARSTAPGLHDLVTAGTAGYAYHLFADACTPMGIKLLL